MEQHRKLALSIGSLGICVLLLASSAPAWDGGDLKEEFHHSYPLSAGGRVELENINGPVHITAWDQNEVKVDAVKSANSKERLDEAQIEVEASSGSVSIRTKYPEHDHTWNSNGWNNPASVEYTLMVPRGARLDEIKLINGALDIHGVAGEVRASCVNGKLTAQGLQGRTELSSVNGRMEAQFDRLNDSIDLSSVNGALNVTLPSDAKGEIEASTVSGNIENDFGIHVDHHHWVGHEMRAELGTGGGHIKLSNVNGHIDIHRASDGKTMSPVKDLGSHDKDDDDDKI